MAGPQTFNNIKVGLTLAGFVTTTYLYTIYKMKQSIDGHVAEFSDKPGSAAAAK